MPSKLHKYCDRCNYKDDCDDKRMAACAFISTDQIMADADAPIMQDIAAPIMRKHDYREVWIDPNTTITIDLEDIKEQMKRDFYKNIGCPFINGA